MKTFIVVLMVALIAGCGGSPNDDKSLFSTWVEDKEDGSVKNFLTLDFDIETRFTSHMPDGAVCEGTILFEGTQSRGYITYNNFIWIPGTGDMDPNCNALNQVVVYVHDDNDLSLQDGAGTLTYWH